MEFWYNLAQNATLFASPIMIEVLYGKQLARKQLIKWNLILFIVSIISIRVQYLGMELEDWVNFLPIAMLSTLTLNVIVAKRFLGISWKLSFVLASLSTALYRAVYAIIGNVLDDLFPSQLDWAIFFKEPQLFATRYLLIALLIYSVILLISVDIRRKSEKANLLDVLTNYPSSITDVILCVCLLVFIITVGRLFVMDNTFYISIAVTSGVSGAVYFFCKNVMLTQKKVIEQQAYFQNLEQYRHSVETAHDEVFMFKKRYYDILSTIDSYLVAENLSGLKDFYRDTISESDYELNEYTKKLGTISNIKEDFIKGILFSKQQEAQQRQVSFNVKVLEKFQADTKDPVKIIRILGNLLDNAIDAAEMTMEKKLDIVFFIDEHGQRKIIISNSRQREAMNISELKQRGKTMKEEHSGIGLSNIAKLCDFHTQVEFKLLDNQFVSTITLS
ncbi:GHKL domain-containing protein [Enterococcus sp. BWR-S5]|uniref:GHKL domain-containing protein n=1 Tax=Enterococcus sp. BWR-S5 TaxID=2787714 RepID=UPI0019225D55|nr:GHKL domain-containing protein [Enterococcus sp. BWR-S5]MBL1226013.1 GHKL domain-containing protein [Enterococcus sp. BWR-S5]